MDSSNETCRATGAPTLSGHTGPTLAGLIGSLVVRHMHDDDVLVRLEAKIAELNPDGYREAAAAHRVWVDEQDARKANRSPEHIEATIADAWRMFEAVDVSDEPGFTVWTCSTGAAGYGDSPKAALRHACRQTINLWASVAETKGESASTLMAALEDLIASGAPIALDGPPELVAVLCGDLELAAGPELTSGEQTRANRLAWPPERLDATEARLWALLEALDLPRDPCPAVWVDAEGNAAGTGASVFEAAANALRAEIAAWRNLARDGELYDDDDPAADDTVRAVLGGRAVRLSGSDEAVVDLLAWTARAVKGDASPVGTERGSR